MLFSSLSDLHCALGSDLFKHHLYTKLNISLGPLLQLLQSLEAGDEVQHEAHKLGAIPEQGVPGGVL